MKKVLLLLMMTAIFCCSVLPCSSVEFKKGNFKFGKQMYNYSYVVENKKVSFINFEPMIPRNDKILIAIMRDAVKKAYNIKLTVNPVLEPRNDKKLIVFNQGKTKYLFLLIKDDSSGEPKTHSFTLWKE
jgi:hypothetical protein